MLTKKFIVFRHNSTQVIDDDGCDARVLQTEEIDRVDSLADAELAIDLDLEHELDLGSWERHIPYDPRAPEARSRYFVVEAWVKA